MSTLEYSFAIMKGKYIYIPFNFTGTEHFITMFGGKNYFYEKHKSAI